MRADHESTGPVDVPPRFWAQLPGRLKAFAVLTFFMQVLGAGAPPAHAQITVPTDYRKYAIVGESTVNFGSYATVLGDVYGAGDVTLGFGYAIQRPQLNSGNFYTRGNFYQNSLFSEAGSVAANGNVIVTQGSKLTGTVQYGGTLSGPITGPTFHLPNTVPVVALPTAPTFAYGSQNISAPGDLVLQPGSYGDVGFTGFYSSLTLSSGDYYLKSLNAGSSSSVHTLNLNLTNGPIRIYSDGDISFGNTYDVYINGVRLDGNSSTPQAIGALASNILFESNHNISVTGYSTTFAGTLFAPNGTVTLDTQNWYGSVLAGGAINAKGYLIAEPYNFGNSAVASFGAAQSTVIVGGSTSIQGTLTNLAAAGGSTLNYTATGSVASGGLTVGAVQPSPGALAPGAAAALSIPITATQVGSASVAVNINDPNAFVPSSNGFASVNVLDHALLAASSGAAVRAMHGSTAYGNGVLQNVSASFRAGLQITDAGGLLDIAQNAIIANGGSAAVRGVVDTSSFGPTSSTFTVKSSDDQSLPGATALPDKQITVNGSILDNRRVTSTGVVNLGIVHYGAGASGAATLTTTGADDQFTRITVNNSAAADANGIFVSGANSGFQFGLDGLSSTRNVNGIPTVLGAVSGTINLTTNGEANIPGTQVLANVGVPYTLKVFSGQAIWNGSVADVWGNHANWNDTLSNAGAGAPGISGFNSDTATFGNVIGSQMANVALNGANPILAGVTFDNSLGGSYTISVGTGGAINVSAPANGAAITDSHGSHRISTPVTLNGGNSIAVDDAQGVLSIDGSLTSTSGLIKTGPGTLVLSAVSNNVGPVTIAGGTLRGSLADLNSSIANNGALILDQPVDVTYAGVVTGVGSIEKTGLGRVTLSGIDNFSANAPVTISGGALVAPLGFPRIGANIQLIGGGALEAAVSVRRAVAGTGTVVATDDLTIGRSDQPGQFNLGGPAGIGGGLNVGNHAVVLFSKDSAILGSLTTIAEGGSLTTLNGAQLGLDHALDSTKVLNTLGNAVINGNFVNNGLVNGPAEAGQWLTFTQDVRGAGSYTGNVAFGGGFSPGNSPAIVSVGNIAFDSTSKLTMELAGADAGQFDQLLVSGLANLAGTLHLSFLNGYRLEHGMSYPLINGAYSGYFDQIVGLPDGWRVEYLTSGVSVVPEPSTWLLLGSGLGITLLGSVRRKRTAVR